LFRVTGLSLGSQAGSQPDIVVQPGDKLTIDIQWETLAPPAVDYSVFLHLVTDAERALLAQVGALMGETLPTGVWRPGEHFHNLLILEVPADIARGTYELLLGTYFWQTGERLPASVNGEQMSGGRIPIGSLTVAD
jgi:hypothetical protein